jgi:hypothetical protein
MIARRPSPSPQGDQWEGLRNAAEANAEAIHAAASIAMQMMRSLHGERWSVDVDHDDGFVLISRDFAD